jgi:hypothetical protein
MRRAADMPKEEKVQIAASILSADFSRGIFYEKD